jgi:hypothetical protein
MANSDRIRPRRSKGRVLAAVFILPILLPAAEVRADDSTPHKFSIDGFGTLGWVHSSEDQADFLGGLLIGQGAGYSNAWSAEVDSRIGLQLSAALSPRISGVLQVISEQRHDGSYRPRVEWANLKFQFAPEVELRVGRTVLASFLVSDHRKVGYANPWVRPPVELYGIVPVTSSDGVTVEYRLDLAGAAHALQADFGRSDTSLPEGGDVRARKAWGISDTIEMGALTLRVSYRQASLRLPSFNTLFDGFRQFGPEGLALAERYDANGSTFQLAGLAAMYDPGDWFASGEVARVRSHSAIGDRSAWYASAGYRWDEFTPYGVHARSRAHGDDSDPGLTVSNYPPERTETVLGLNAALAELLEGIPSQRTTSLGIRWDVRPNVALKLQYDHTDLDAGSTGVLGNIQPGFRRGGEMDLLSVAVDFVF